MILAESVRKLNDFLDAEAIAEAGDRQNMRFVPTKTDDQLDLQALHRVRDRLTGQHGFSGTTRARVRPSIVVVAVGEPN